MKNTLYSVIIVACLGYMYLETTRTIAFMLMLGIVILWFFESIIPSKPELVYVEEGYAFAEGYWNNWRDTAKALGAYAVIVPLKSGEWAVKSSDPFKRLPRPSLDYVRMDQQGEYVIFANKEAAEQYATFIIPYNYGYSNIT